MRLILICVFVVVASLRADEQRSFAIADSSKGRLAIIDAAGNVEFETNIGPLHDLHVLPGNRILFQRNWQTLAEVDTTSGSEVWSFDARSAVPDYNGKLEVHAFQRLDNGDTMVAISGPSVIVEVDRTGQVTKRIPLRVSESHHHRDTRLVRKLANGHYLVCHEGDGLVREYDDAGETVWEYQVPLVDYPSGASRKRAKGHGPEAFGNQCFSALRLNNGNTLIGTGNGHAVIEVTRAGDVVWSIGQKELPGITLAWVTTLEALPNGNIVIGNCHAGEGQPQLTEVDRNKEVIWTFRDFTRFGNATTNSQILTVNGQTVLGTTLR